MMSKLIPLTHGQFAIVDDEDFERLNQHKWYARRGRNTQNYYACRSIYKSGKVTTIRMHRQILDVPRVDHWDGDTLNNRRSNLRSATNQQNNCNSRRRKDNTSGYKGVRWHKQHRKWEVDISANGRRKCLGLFPENQKTEAARAYDRAAIKYHGDFARLNFPKEEYANG